MTDCIISIEVEHPAEVDDFGTWWPVMEKACCQDFKEDFESEDVGTYSLDADGLLVTYDDLIGDRSYSKTELVKVCPYCGANIIIKDLKKYIDKNMED